MSECARLNPSERKNPSENFILLVVYYVVRCGSATKIDCFSCYRQNGKQKPSISTVTFASRLVYTQNQHFAFVFCAYQKERRKNTIQETIFRVCFLVLYIKFQRCQLNSLKDELIHVDRVCIAMRILLGDKWTLKIFLHSKWAKIECQTNA